MRCLTLEDWMTARAGGASPGTVTITQSESSWLDVQEFYNAVFWLDVKEATLSGATPIVQLTVQTAPSKDDSLFVPVALFTMAPGVSVTVAQKDTATLPLMRWLRWSLSAPTASSTWDATFRVFVALR